MTETSGFYTERSADLTVTPGPWRLKPVPGLTIIVRRLLQVVDPTVDLAATKYVRYRRYASDGATPVPAPPALPARTPDPPSGPVPASERAVKSELELEAQRSEPVLMLGGLHQYTVNAEFLPELFRLRGSLGEYLEIYLSDAAGNVASAPLIGARADILFVGDYQVG